MPLNWIDPGLEFDSLFNDPITAVKIYIYRKFQSSFLLFCYIYPTKTTSWTKKKCMARLESFMNHCDLMWVTLLEGRNYCPVLVYIKKILHHLENCAIIGLFEKDYISTKPKTLRSQKPCLSSLWALSDTVSLKSLLQPDTSLQDHQNRWSGITHTHSIGKDLQVSWWMTV